MVPGKCNSQEKLSDRSVIAKEALNYRASFKYDLLCVFSPGEEKRPRPTTKLLLSALIKA